VARPAGLLGAALALLAALAALAACDTLDRFDLTLPAAAAPGPPPLYYPYPPIPPAGFAGHQRLAEQARGYFVQVRIFAPGSRPDAFGRLPGEALIQAASGTLVDAAGQVVTAAHIAKGRDFTAEVETADGASHLARIVRLDRRQDLALLRVPTLANASPPARRASPPRAGEGVLVLGAPNDRPIAVSVGVVRRVALADRIAYPPFGFDRGIELSIEITQGYSGGPLLDHNGALIGMIAAVGESASTAPDAPPPLLGYAVPAASIWRFLAAGP